MPRFAAWAVAGATLLLTAAAPLQTEKYTIDPEDTYIGFSARHLMVTTVKGKFRSFSGEIDLDEKDITKSVVRVTIAAASITTDNERRDNHLRSDDFLNAAQYPKISFVSRRVEKKDGRLVLIGDLTIRDVTREVAIPFEMTGPVKLPGGKKQLGVEGSLTINRFDYNLKYNKLAETVQVVAPEVHLELNVAATN